jgi:hypothetical protein
MPKGPTSFRIGKVRAHLRGRIWYLCYHEHGRRRRPRVGPDRKAARQLAAQINGQLAMGAPAALSFEPISVPALRQAWLQHHEQVLRSSVQTIARYRTATDHLLRFLEQQPVRHASLFLTFHAEAFVRHLRTIRVSSNGHPNTAKRPLLDKGLHYILECCRALFNYAAKRRHLSPYAENPFGVLEIDRVPIEHARPVELFTREQESGGDIKLTTAVFVRPNGKNLSRLLTNGREDEDWGVRPDEGLAVRLAPVERKLLFEHLDEKTIIPPPKPESDPKRLQFEDRQLEAALGYLRKKS